MMTRIAIVQTAPIFLDKVKTIELAVSSIHESASNGANLVVFSETFIPGYPAWIWRLRPGADWGTSETLHHRLTENAVRMDSEDLAPLYEAAKQHGVTVVCGIEELDSNLSRTTLYNTVITIGPDGKLLNRHRKLMPTNPERMAWGFGDATGLKVVETDAGRLGALMCWENYMPLARYALYAQGVEIYIAPTYDSGDGWLGTMQHIAREGCCWVVSCGCLLHASDIPDDLPEKESLYPDSDEWINPGDSVVIAPGGEIVAGPLHQQSGILYHELDRDSVNKARRALDVASHYSRPDIFQLHVHRQPQAACVFDTTTDK